MGEELLPISALIAIIAVGLVAGLFGGMLGIGGSLVIIPALTLVLGTNQHLYQASAMIVNVVVAVPAFLRHRREGVLVKPVLQWMLPSAVLLVILGVWLSNRPIFAGIEGGLWLGRILAGFLAIVILMNILRLLRPRRQPAPEAERKLQPWRSTTIGSIMGLLAGLLGIGGGVLAVPMQQVALKLPLRNCIGNATAVMSVSAVIGALYKNATLSTHAAAAQANQIQPAFAINWQNSLILALILAPTAWLGARWGAGLTHRLPMWQVRVAFIILMSLAAARMAGLF